MAHRHLVKLLHVAQHGQQVRKTGLRSEPVVEDLHCAVFEVIVGGDVAEIRRQDHKVRHLLFFINGKKTHAVIIDCPVPERSTVVYEIASLAASFFKTFKRLPQFSFTPPSPSETLDFERLLFLGGGSIYFGKDGIMLPRSKILH